MDTFPAAYCPTSGTSAQTTPRVLRAQFGDGYSQSALDGLNAHLRKWSLQFEPIQTSTGTISLGLINEWLEAHAGQRFLWVQPPPFGPAPGTGNPYYEGAKTFECIEWSWSYQTGSIVGLTATFEQRAET
jgi:phage-related protein